eukprot:COSAG05_NODE_53_length_23772_cov_13.856630_5_plen_78_part_00
MCNYVVLGPTCFDDTLRVVSATLAAATKPSRAQISDISSLMLLSVGLVGWSFEQITVSMQCTSGYDDFPDHIVLVRA